jgi:hypothetical protein
MPRPKKTPEYQEGPQAAENFERTLGQILRAGRPSALVTERRETVMHESVTAQVTRKPKRTKKRSKATTNRG